MREIAQESKRIVFAVRNGDDGSFSVMSICNPKQGPPTPANQPIKEYNFHSHCSIIKYLTSQCLTLQQILHPYSPSQNFHAPHPQSSNFTIDLINSKLHFLHDLLALLKDLLLLIQLLPCYFIHVLNIPPVDLDLLLQLLDPRTHLLHYVLVLVLDVGLEQLHLISQEFYLGEEALRIYAGLLADVLKVAFGVPASRRLGRRTKNS